MGQTKGPRKTTSENEPDGKAPRVVQLSLPSPISALGVADVQEDFAKITSRTPRRAGEQEAFIASKLHVLRTHPGFSLQERGAAVAALESKLERKLPKKSGGPVPGGVGYGMFYNDAFKINFNSGTAVYWEVICPQPPGGNVSDYLYLTATNRSALGVEALVSYYAQDPASFVVFDWARFPSAPWQTNVPLSNLGNYLRTESSHGHPYQVLPILNVTTQSNSTYWYNQVWLLFHVNNVASAWNLVYQYGYSATLLQQKTGWVGSWGPIVETFQNAYSGTNPMGALNTQLISRAGNQWGTWHLLGPADSYVRVDNKGFQLMFLDADYTWAVNS